MNEFSLSIVALMQIEPVSWMHLHSTNHFQSSREDRDDSYQSRPVNDDNYNKLQTSWWLYAIETSRVF